MAGKRKQRGGNAKKLAQKARKKSKQNEKNNLNENKDQAQQEHTFEISENPVEEEKEAPQNTTSEGLLSKELLEEYGAENEQELLIVSSNKKKQKKETKADKEIMELATTMSKSKRKKLEKIAERKKKEARRDQLYESLQSKSISEQHLNLMYSTSKLGHKETLKERLKRSINKQKAGIELSTQDTQELYHQARDMDIDMKEEDQEEEEEEDEDEEEEDKKKDIKSQQKNKKKSSSIGRKTSSSSSTSSSPQVDTTELDDATIEKARQQKKKKNKKIVHNVLQFDVLTQQQQQPNQSTTVVQPRHQQQQHEEEEEEPEATSTATSTSSNSMSDAMARLQALRAKNEAKRLQKQQQQEEDQTKEEEEEEASASTHDQVYIPKPIVLKTHQELKKLSQQTALSYKTTLVQVKRKPAIQLARMQLPVCSSEQEIMEAIVENDVIILCGETGSGKTTQVPQFLYEAGFGHPKHELYNGMIGVTQPRRVAAVSTAQRVAEELNVAFGKQGQVGYQIRYDTDHIGDKARIKFMTDGILLKEVQNDFLLRKYSIILLDEAHERNVNTDILIGLLSRIAPLRAQIAKEEQQLYGDKSVNKSDGGSDDVLFPQKPLQPLKLVIMSATLRVEDFTQNKVLFPIEPPVLRVEARQYPVTIHFSKTTEMDDYVDAAFKKVCKIHQKLPEGGILVFLTGQREILQLIRKLKQRYTKKNKQQRQQVLHVNTRRRKQQQEEEDNNNKKVEDKQEEEEEEEEEDTYIREHDDIEEQADLEEAELYGLDEDNKSLSDDEEESEEEESDDDEDEDESPVPFVHVLPLYSLLSNEEQMKVFEPVPEGHRLIVVSTNVAETSLTIPGIKYVVDAGRSKEKVFDLTNGISKFDIQWTSKASADQRAGRAGRTGPGHCYRLYSSAVYDTEFPKFSMPEILCQPIEDLILQMKAMGIHQVVKFPFPTPPPRQAILKAVKTLIYLGAIEFTSTTTTKKKSTSNKDEKDEKEEEEEEGNITALGKILSKFPIAARFAKMLLLAKEMNVLQYMIAIVAGLSGHSPFIPSIQRKEQQQMDAEDDKEEKEQEEKDDDDDDEMLKEWKELDELRKHTQWIDEESDVLGLLRAAGAYAFVGGSREFCQENHLHEKTMQQMLQLRHQLTRIVNQVFTQDLTSQKKFTPIELKPQNLSPPNAKQQVLIRQIIAAGFLDQIAKRIPAGTIENGSKLERNCAYQSCDGLIKDFLYIHPHSHVFTPNPKKLSEFVVFQHIQHTTRNYMKSVTVIEPEWLHLIGQNTPLVKYSKPLSVPPPKYDELTDQVKCYVNVYYGHNNLCPQWELPTCLIEFPERKEEEKLDKYRWVAKFFLDGKLIPSFSQVFNDGVNKLKEPSMTIVKRKYDKKIQLLVSRLVKNHIFNRQQLLNKWTTNPRFLLTEIIPWIKNPMDQKLLKETLWKQCVQQALL